jgi:hypothetical protein
MIDGGFTGLISVQDFFPAVIYYCHIRGYCGHVIPCPHTLRGVAEMIKHLTPYS